ncbi:hypothetical protein [Lactiplantibacillus daowaiensis]|uniref:Extracellular protein n=1 Tax=Lactiplantibacillus daowaiensis TaxID=2559918 RepID=A0ABW1S3Q6_9LACO|nr:hypothetical protein [Lactiplantibacillus daowaiensis]
MKTGKIWRYSLIVGILIVLVGGGAIFGQAKHQQRLTAERVAKKQAAKQRAKKQSQRLATKKQQPLTAAQKRRRAADKVDGVGKVIRTKRGDAHQPMVLANDSVKFYDSLKHVNNRYHVTVDGDEEEISPPIKVVVAKYFYTQKGTYCLIQNLHHVAVTRPFDVYQAKTWTHLTPNKDWGYIALKDLKPTTYYRQQTTIQKTPYYLVSFDGKNPSNLAMNLGNTTYHAWSNVPGTVFRAFAHDTDTLLNQQLYATKQLIRTDGRKYLYMQTATGRVVGWLPATGQLVRGYYQDVGRRLLNPQAGETMTRTEQAPIKRTLESGYISRSRIYRVYRQHQLQRLLILTAMNTPIKVTFKHQQPTQLTFYQPHYQVSRQVKVQPKTKTYTKTNEYGAVADVTIYRQSKTTLLKFVDGDDQTDEEGFSTKGSLDRVGHVKFSSGIWSNQDD